MLQVNTKSDVSGLYLLFLFFFAPFKKSRKRRTMLVPLLLVRKLTVLQLNRYKFSQNTHHNRAICHSRTIHHNKAIHHSKAIHHNRAICHSKAIPPYRATYHSRATL